MSETPREGENFAAILEEDVYEAFGIPGELRQAWREIKTGRVVTCSCDWPHGHCETCARVWGYTAVHITPDGSCAMYGHREGDLT